MKLMYKIILSTLLIYNSACSQPIKENLVGSWFRSCDVCEFNDLIILRSDHKYFVYNPNSADIGSFELTGELKSNDIRIDGAYTAISEKGIWDYDTSTKDLVFTERSILEEWTDFSEVYGKSKELKFYLKELTENEIELCNKEGKQLLCEKYERNNSENDSITFYKEVTEDFTGTGSQVKEILLSGYETELKLSYEFYKEPDELIIEDRSGKVLFTTNMVSTSERKTMELSLRGVTKLAFKIRNERTSSKWKIMAEIK